MLTWCLRFLMEAYPYLWCVWEDLSWSALMMSVVWRWFVSFVSDACWLVISSHAASTMSFQNSVFPNLPNAMLWSRRWLTTFYKSERIRHIKTCTFTVNRRNVQTRNMLDHPQRRWRHSKMRQKLKEEERQFDLKGEKSPQSILFKTKELLAAKGPPTSKGSSTLTRIIGSCGKDWINGQV